MCVRAPSTTAEEVKLRYREKKSRNTWLQRWNVFISRVMHSCRSFTLPCWRFWMWIRWWFIHIGKSTNCLIFSMLVWFVGIFFLFIFVVYCYRLLHFASQCAVQIAMLTFAVNQLIENSKWKFHNFVNGLDNLCDRKYLLFCSMCTPSSLSSAFFLLWSCDIANENDALTHIHSDVQSISIEFWFANRKSTVLIELILFFLFFIEQNNLCSPVFYSMFKAKIFDGWMIFKLSAGHGKFQRYERQGEAIGGKFAQIHRFACDSTSKFDR